MILFYRNSLEFCF